MIQRVQSIYWLLTAVVLVAFLFLPMFGYGPSGKENVFAVQDCMTLTIATSLAALLSLATIFLVNNRPLQIKLSWLIALVILLGFTGSAAVNFLALSNGEAPAAAGDIVSFKWPLVLPFVALVLNFLAMRGVKADQKLVSASDRLR
ncbi:MAG: DUF4293 domain-containing protein [Chitinophagales bacterium]